MEIIMVIHKEEKESPTNEDTQMEEEMPTKEKISSSFADLFRNKSVRKNFLCMSFNWYVSIKSLL